MSQVETSKATSFVAGGSDSDEQPASKVVMFVILTPGDDGSSEEGTRDCFVHTQIIRRH